MACIILFPLSQIDGELYWYYEYLVRKSPTKSVSVPFSTVIISAKICQPSFLWSVDALNGYLQAQETNLYRHYVASTAEREGRIIKFIPLFLIFQRRSCFMKLLKSLQPSLLSNFSQVLKTNLKLPW